MQVMNFYVEHGQTPSNNNLDDPRDLFATSLRIYSLGYVPGPQLGKMSASDRRQYIANLVGHRTPAEGEPMVNQKVGTTCSATEAQAHLRNYYASNIGVVALTQPNASLDDIIAQQSVDFAVAASGLEVSVPADVSAVL